MPKKVKGWGILAREIEQRVLTNPQEASEALKAALVEWRSFYERVDEYIEARVELLAKHGSKWTDHDLADKYGIENYPVAAAEMIGCHVRLQAARSDLAKGRGTDEGVAEAAFELGRLVERNNVWRFRKDPDLKQGQRLPKGKVPGLATRNLLISAEN
jgi:hypothetical protein